jgi:hypothetical protein
MKDVLGSCIGIISVFTAACDVDLGLGATGISMYATEFDFV